MMSRDIREKVIDSLRDARRAITGRGGEISPTAGLKDFADAIYNIPADNAITTVEKNEVAKSVIVPANSTKYAYLAEFGGMTHRDAETNTLHNAKPTEIVSEGVNLYSGSAEFVLDGTDKNITIPIVGAEEITTLSFIRDGTRVNAASLFQLVYEDGTTFGLAPGVPSGVETIKYTSKSKVTAIKLVNWCKFTGRVYDIQLENGSVATEYKPYVGTVATRAIPAEIQALDGFGEGVSIDYYNKVDLVNKKYKRSVETMVIDGSEDWSKIYSDYFALPIGEHGMIVAHACICDKYETVSVAQQPSSIGITVINSAAYSDARILLRPKGFTSEMTKAELKEILSKEPLTVTYALATPEEYDLPVKMNPLIEVEGGGTIEFVNEYGNAVPSKTIYQTLMQ
jgi:hypothetical protein